MSSSSLRFLDLRHAFEQIQSHSRDHAYYNITSSWVVRPDTYGRVWAEVRRMPKEILENIVDAIGLTQRAY